MRYFLRINRLKTTGFTLIELLVVISIVSLLSSVVLSSLSGARENARKSSTQAELQSIRTGIQMLINDTGKWPNGCPPGGVANPEVGLNNNQAGLLSRPSVGVVDSPCEWTTEQVNSWDGPYVDVNDLEDPWGRGYRFDPDYWPYRSCGSKAEKSVRPVIFSHGPTNAGSYDCDAIYLNMS